MSEIKLQADCFQWAWNFIPETRYLLFHVPNGGKRSYIEAAQMKASGVVAGVPDMLLMWNGRAYAFELKTETGSLSRQQVTVINAWKAQGICVHVVRTVDQFQSLIKGIVRACDPPLPIDQQGRP